MPSPFAIPLATLLVAAPEFAGVALPPLPQAVDCSFMGSPFAAEHTVTCGGFGDIAASLTAVSLGSVAWGDYDNDGDLDVLITGQVGTGQVAKVHRNDGGAFTDIGASLTAVYFSSVAWADYDNDGDLDILLSGFDGSAAVAKVYRNDGGIFSDIGASLTTAAGAVAWGDHDNDGDLDILLTGFDDSLSALAKVHRNNGGAFTSIAASLPGVAESSVAWGDYDNDGDLDILLAGVAPIDGASKVHRNDGGGAFTDIGASLVGVENCSLAWGDYDNDGDLDILLTGLSTVGREARVYRNDSGVFTDIGASLIAVENSSAAWGDFDNDGDLDILLTGLSAGGPVSKVYRNDGGAFIDIGAVLIAVANSSVAWGDYDNDGDLDILLTGARSTGARVARVYRNEACLPNTPPAAPGALNSSVTAGGTTFNWSASTDAQTPSPGLHYNLRVGTTSGGNEISSAMANPSGTRRVARLGNAQQSGWKLQLPAGNYYWSVQAIDPAFAGSPFAPEQTLTVGAVDVPSAANLPIAFAFRAQPNPFSRFAVIGFDLPRQARVVLRIHDLGGRVVRTLADGSWAAGRHQLEWDGTDRDGRPAPAGVYFYAIEAGDFRSRLCVVRLN